MINSIPRDLHNYANKILKSGCRVSGNIEVFEMNEDSFFEIDEPKDFTISEILMKSKNN